MKVITIISQKGGSGKTTLSLGIAGVAHSEGKRCIVADCDEQASATMWFKARGSEMPHVQPTHTAYLSSFAEEVAKQDVDFLVVDTAPQSNSGATNAAEIADIILITCEPSIMDLRAIQNTVKLVKLASLKPTAKVYAVLTKVEHWATQDKRETIDVLNRLDLEVVPYNLGRRVAYRHALIDGQTIAEFDKGGKADKELGQIYKHILD